MQELGWLPIYPFQARVQIHMNIQCNPQRNLGSQPSPQVFKFVVGVSWQFPPSHSKLKKKNSTTRSPSNALLPFFGGGFPTRMGCRKKKRYWVWVVPTYSSLSNLEDLDHKLEAVSSPIGWVSRGRGITRRAGSTP